MNDDEKQEIARAHDELGPLEYHRPDPSAEARTPDEMTYSYWKAIYAEEQKAAARTRFHGGEWVILALVIVVSVALVVFLGALAVALVRILWRLG